MDQVARRRAQVRLVPSSWAQPWTFQLERDTSAAAAIPNATPASPAKARARRVLPTPEGPSTSTPLGTAAPSEPLRAGKKIADLRQLHHGLVDTGQSAKVSGDSPARRAPARLKRPSSPPRA